MNTFLFVKSIGTITEPSYDNRVFHFITNHELLLLSSNISNTRKNVSSDIQTLRSGLRNEVQAEFFLTNLKVF